MRFDAVILQCAAEFIHQLSNQTSLITVTHVTVAPGSEGVTVFISVLPKNKEGEVLRFLSRHQNELRSLIRKRTHRAVQPVTFTIDNAETAQLEARAGIEPAQ